MKEAVYVLLGAAFTIAAAWAAGRWLLARLRIDFLHREEERAFAFLLGSALLSQGVFALAAAQILYKGTLLALGLAALAAGARRSTAPRFPALPRAWVWSAAPVFTLFSLLYVTHAMAPEMSPDGSAYHLGLVSRYYREHGFPAITTNIYANLSQGVEMLFLFAWPWGKHSAAALTHLAFLYALASLVLSYGRRFGFPLAGAGAAALVWLSPVAALDAASAYNDVAVAAIVFGMFYLLQVWRTARHASLLIAVGMLAGFAFAAKYTAFVALIYALGIVAFELWRTRWLVRSLVTVSAIAALWIAPWLLKNAIVVGNPVSPFANRVFRNPYVHVAFEEFYRQHMRNYDFLQSHWDIPLEVTVRGQALCGLLGPVFLLAPLALLAWRRPHGRALLSAAALFGSIYVTNIGTRFLLMAVPFVALGMAAMLAQRRALLAVVLAMHAASAWPDLMKLYCHEYAWRLDRIQWKAALRIESQDGFLARKWPSYNVARLIDAVTPPNARVFSFSQTSEAYTTRDVLVSFQSAEGTVLRNILWSPLYPDMQPTRHQHFFFPPRSRRRLRVLQSAAAGPDDHFGIHELRFYHQGRELPRDPQWRLRAWPNPWNVQDAFDGSPVTRWASWEKLWPGMFIEVDFGRDATIDRVTVEGSPETGRSQVHLDFAPELAPVEQEAPRPLGLRREAVEVLRARGVTHVLIADTDFGHEDYHARRDEWGLVELGERNGVRLYALR
ncbi:MAG: hypothetical protein IT162_05545 [Bryobacterales bacterium]|nr:hypothetical protein [Bryobacterales bacterium]